MGRSRSPRSRSPSGSPASKRYRGRDRDRVANASDAPRVTPATLDTLRRIDECDAYEAIADAVASPYDLAIALHDLEDVTNTASSVPFETRHDIFRLVVAKAVEYFSGDVVLEVLAYIDRYYHASRRRALDAEVHQYILRVINNPVPRGIRRLLGRILEGKTNKYDILFGEAGEAHLARGPVVSRPDTWVKYEPTIEDETARMIQWIDSRCAVESLAAAVDRVRGFFQEPKREDQEGEGDGDAAADGAIATESLSVDLTCPLSKTRIVIPAYGRDTRHIQPFDLEHFLSVNIQRTRSLEAQGKDPLPWKCPITNQSIDKDSILICPFFADVLAKVPSHVRQVVVAKDATWRAEAPPSAAQQPEETDCIMVEDGPFDPKYDVVVKTEK